jgi:hypothetical protein
MFTSKEQHAHTCHVEGVNVGMKVRIGRHSAPFTGAIDQSTDTRVV